MKAKRSWLLVTATLLALPACDSPSSLEPSYFNAVITLIESGEHSVENYEGSGTFKVMEAAHRFNLSSEGTDGSDGQSFIMDAFQSGRPTTGSHMMRQWQGVQDNGEPGVIAQYWRTLPDGAAELFFADSGEVIIARSDRDYVAGSFELTGFLWCRRPNGHEDPTDSEGYCDGVFPAVIPAETPRITVTGSFGAVPREPVDVQPSVP